MKKLSIIIVNYNVSYFLEQVLKSVFNSKVDFDFDVWVVDNNSVDNSLEMLEESFPQVKVITNDFNAGFSRANNQAIDKSDAEYILLLNPDTVIEEDTLQKCADHLDAHQDVGALGVKMVDGKGRFLPESKRGLPTPWVAFYKISGLASLFPTSKRFGRYHLKFLKEDEVNEVDVLAGAFMFIRNSVYREVGGLDNDYFMYGEDIDLSYKIQQAGYKNIYYPETRIIHYKGESTKKSSVNYVFVFYKAMVIFARKHFSKKKARAVSLLIYLAIYLKAFTQVSRNTFRKVSLPLVDFLLGYAALYVLANYWEDHYKKTDVDFPQEYYFYVLPVYMLAWGLFNYFAGANDRPYRFSKIVLGSAWGILVISAFSNFLDSHRYSKAVILLGGISVMSICTLNRLLRNFISYKSFSFSKDKTKRVALIGHEDEINRVQGLIKRVDEDLTIAGYIIPEFVKHPKHKGDYLGSLSQLKNLVEVYKLEELIFCSKDISSTMIIDLMIDLNDEDVDFKIVPDESHYIIGSNSKNKPGDYYTADVKLNLSQANHRRNKRLVDMSLSLFVLACIPVLALIVKNKTGLFKNAFKVFFGSKTWVGLCQESSRIKKIRPGVLSCVDEGELEFLDREAQQRMDFLYAKDYSYWQDISLFFRNIKFLGK